MLVYANGQGVHLPCFDSTVATLMEMRFIKLPGNRDAIEVVERQRGPDIQRAPRETGPTLPHDLAHAAVESALGIVDGFWGAVDEGAVFEDFKPLDPNPRHRRSGLKRLSAVGEREALAEHKVSWAHRVWSGQRTEGRGLGASPLTQNELECASSALNVAYEKWKALPVMGRLVWRWAPDLRRSC